MKITGVLQKAFKNFVELVQRVVITLKRLPFFHFFIYCLHEMKGSETSIDVIHYQKAEGLVETRFSIIVNLGQILTTSNVWTHITITHACLVVPFKTPSSR